MNSVKISRSFRQETSVVILWNDGMSLYFDALNLSSDPVVCGIASEGEMARRIVVSRTSAEVTLNGCAVNA